MSETTATRTTVGHLDDLDVAAMKMVKVDGHRLCLVRTSEGVFALDQACPHEGYGLTTGELDGDLITCAWHNWKFRVNDGVCVLGEEDVRTHPVHVADDGTLSVEFHEPDPAELRPKIMRSLRSGIEKQYVGQISRDVVRLLRADSNPGELIWEAVAYGAPRAEFGWGHSIASLKPNVVVRNNRCPTPSPRFLSTPAPSSAVSSKPSSSNRHRRCCGVPSNTVTPPTISGRGSPTSSATTCSRTVTARSTRRRRSSCSIASAGIAPTRCCHTSCRRSSTAPARTSCPT